MEVLIGGPISVAQTMEEANKTKTTVPSLSSLTSHRSLTTPTATLIDGEMAMLARQRATTKVWKLRAVPATMVNAVAMGMEIRKTQRRPSTSEMDTANIGPRKKPRAAKEIGEIARVLLIWKCSTMPGMLPRYTGMVRLLYKIGSAKLYIVHDAPTLRSLLGLDQMQRQASCLSTSCEGYGSQFYASSPEPSKRGDLRSFLSASPN